MKKIYIILNPKAGNDEPILTYLNDILGDSDLDWEVFITKKADDAKKYAQKAIDEQADIVVSYGGDGTVSEIAHILYKKDTPLYILPGGTANIMSKELGIPQKTEEAIKLLVENKLEVKDISMGLMNGVPFLIRVNFGFLADMITNTSRKSKDRFGVFSYVFTAIKHILKPTKQQYLIYLDGTRIDAVGSALVVANSGNIGIPGYSLVPDINIDDEFLDVVLFTEADLGTMASFTTNALSNKEAPALKRWKGKSIKIKVKPTQTIIFDDVPMQAKRTEFSIAPNSLKVMVPKNYENTTK